MARTKQDDITLSGLREKFTQQIDKKNKEIDELKKELNLSNKRIVELERGISIYSTDESTTKKILQLRSRGYAPTKILDRCEHVGIETNLDNIKSIVNNIEELDNEYRVYYKQCVEDYEKEIKINPQILRQIALDDIQFQIDEMKEIIAKAKRDNEDTQTIAKYMDKLDIYIKTRATILKDVVFEEDNSKEPSAVINIMSDDYEEQKSNIFKIQLDEHVKIIN